MHGFPSIIGQVQYVDHKRLVSRFHDGLTQDPILTWKSDENRVKTPESLLSQAMKLNYQVEAQDHIHAQFLFQKKG